MDPGLEAHLKKWFVEPHGIAAYDAKYPGRENWTPAMVVLYGVAYADAQHFSTTFAKLDAIAAKLGGGG